VSWGVCTFCDGGQASDCEELGSQAGYTEPEAYEYASCEMVNVSLDDAGNVNKGQDAPPAVVVGMAQLRHHGDEVKEPDLESQVLRAGGMRDDDDDDDDDDAVADDDDDYGFRTEPWLSAGRRGRVCALHRGGPPIPLKKGAPVIHDVRWPLHGRADAVRAVLCCAVVWLFHQAGSSVYSRHATPALKFPMAIEKVGQPLMTRCCISTRRCLGLVGVGSVE
jgi:hypothetical protein